ncbi:hypothetical protein [Intestinibacillus massiliensis]|uniref:hypothetical protein n=1 Tax=Intestinibacillus massiliensis TaxID=1871029 RepID=UPI00190E61C7|nr:hypothetical protein [Intestinibacillus massiliensis]
MLELDNLQNLAVHFKGYTVSELTCGYHIKSSKKIKNIENTEHFTSMPIYFTLFRGLWQVVLSIALYLRHFHIDSVPHAPILYAASTQRDGGGRPSPRRRSHALKLGVCLKFAAGLSAAAAAAVVIIVVATAVVAAAIAAAVAAGVIGHRCTAAAKEAIAITAAAPDQDDCDDNPPAVVAPRISRTHKINPPISDFNLSYGSLA